MLSGKSIVLGVTGGIAAYKSAELARLLVQSGASVRVVMTAHAREFVSPLTFQALTHNTVLTDLFSLSEDSAIHHVSIASDADVIIVAPATANFLAKAAHGIADDLLTSMLLVARCPLLIAPAMNTNMYLHPATRANEETLRGSGCHFVGPSEGDLACGWAGPGRMAEPAEILEEARVLMSIKNLAGEKLLITAGPTRERIDPVRFLTNPSSGKMGYALARAARRRGATVTLVSGPTMLSDPTGTRVLRVESAREMRDAVIAEAADATVCILAAAVSDFAPAQPAEKKLKKGLEPLVLTLERTPDALSELGADKRNRILVGFAAETDDVRRNATTKLKQKNLDLIVANDVTQPGAGFGSDENEAWLIRKAGKATHFRLRSKDELAETVLDRILEIRKESLQPAPKRRQKAASKR